MPIRRARVSDARRIFELLSSFVRRGEILPRPLADIYQSIRDWVVVEQDGEIIGCGSLLVMWEDLAEIRSLVVSEAHQGNGHGRQMVSQLLEDALTLGVTRVFALTRITPFFERLGFHVTTKEALPRKVYKDCMHCLKFPICDETAVILELQPSDGGEQALAEAGPSAVPVLSAERVRLGQGLTVGGCTSDQVLGAGSSLATKDKTECRLTCEL